MPRKRKETEKPKKSKSGAMTNQKSLSFFVRTQVGAIGRVSTTKDGSLPCDANADAPVDDPNLERRKRTKLTPPSGYIDKSDLTKTSELAASFSQLPESRREQLQAVADRDLGDIDTSGTIAVDEREQDDALAREVDVPSCTPPDRMEAVGSGHTTRTPTTLSPDPPTVARDQTPLDSTSVPAKSQQDMRPRKMLRLKGNGTFSSPPQKPSSDPPKITKRGRPKKAEKHLLMAWKYPEHVNFTVFGQRIERILNGSERVPHPTSKAEQPKISPKEQAGPPKPTHPFFLGKAALDKHAKRKLEEAAVSAERECNEEKSHTPRIITGTPAIVRAQAQAQRAANESSSLPSFGILTKRTAFTKHPGARDAPWPSLENAHVRGTSSPLPHPVRPDADSLSIASQKKCKSPAVVTSDEEYVVKRSVEWLFSKRGRTFGLEGAESSADYTSALRKPNRLLISGMEIQQQISRELIAQLEEENGGMADIPASQPRSMKSHAASQKIYSSIKDYLTPFDRFQCEPQLWAHKYAPQRAEEVLQPGPEAILLRDWLRKCTISAVDTGSKGSVASFESGTAKKAPVKAAKKKKRKRAEDLNDFIVSSDDDGEELEELVEDEKYSLSVPPGTRSLVRGGVDNLQSGQSMKKVGSTILLSGPRGCGKTAAVYAVAKELGFEVFEINPGSRRSGKDVLDRIGDMTENHLVQQVAKALSEPKPEHAMEPIDVEPATEKPDRKQKSMASFFKPLVKKTSDPTDKEASMKTPRGELKSTKSRPQHQQKQSLILLEEVDVLFDDDKNFWLTVLTLAKHSKRPIVLTCNDENLVPLEALTLHAILRFNTSPLELAADYLLLLAAREGHRLNRSAVETLYQSVDGDLRASIMELDFWCQMGVGADNCLEWLFQRWPSGSDVDKHGRTLRVVSEDTYLPGMGWYGRDMVCSSVYDKHDAEHAVLLEARKDWSVSDEDLQATSGLLTDPSDGNDQQSSTSENLLNFELRSECLSAADIYCGLNKKTDVNHQAVDSSLPELADSAKANYIIGWPLLEADPPPEYIDLDNQLACSALALSRNTSTSVPHRIQTSSSPAEQHLISAILSARSRQRSKSSLTRKDFSLAFDVLAEPPSSQQPSSSSVTTSSLDREFSVITTDVAPYIRSITAYDLMLEEERLRLSNLLSVSGRAKRMRTTRAARSALEGGRRETTRRERWFDKNLNLRLALETGGKTWAGMGGRADEKRADEVEAEVRSMRSGDDDEMEG